jgi:uncharacterized protein YbaR (Trm112 family)
MTIDAELLQILACPVCRGELGALYEQAAQGSAGEPCGLACKACALVYPVRDGIPVLLKEEAVSQMAWDKRL